MVAFKLLIFGVCCVVFKDTNAQDCTANPPSNGDVNGATVATTIAADSDATYTCSSGFTLDGTSTLTCTTGVLGTAGVAGTEPTCEADCSATAPANGLVDGASTTLKVTHTNTVTYSCNSGYILSSAATLTCASGSLVGTVPSCVVGCTATAPANGLVDGAPTVSVTDTNTVTYSCNSGYILTSGATLTCTSGSLVGTVPTCVVGCTATAPTNGLVDGAPTVSVTDTNTVTYSCNSGYILTSGATLTCTSGSLVGTVPSCVVGCTATAPTNGLVDGAPTVSVTDTNTVTYSCNSGYILTSGATLTCTSGNLVGTVPSCVVGCTATAPANGLVDGAPTVSVTDTNTVTYSCNSGYILTSGATLTCTSGSLVGTVPSCVVGCTATAPANGLVDGAPTVSVTDTNTVTYSCNSGYILTSGATLTCTSGSLVGTVPSCVVGCTATAPANGLVDGEPTVSVTDTNTVTYSCNSGYILTSGATLTCTSGSLVGTVPSCVVGCTATAPANGLVDGAPTVSVTDTNTVTYSCNSGYILTSGATLTCTSGSLVGTVPSCVVGCTATAPANGLVDGAPTVSVTDTNTVTYSCNSGYILTSGATLTCTSGSLVGTVPSCVVGCTATAPANGLVDGAPTVSVTDTNTVTYSCNSGYILTSGATLTCTSGSLVGTVPSCVVGCTATAPANGLVDGVPTVSVTDTNTVTYSCNSGYILTSGATLTCTSGSLVGTVPTCVVGCTATAPANGLVDGAPTVSVTDTNTVTYSCNSGYILTSGATLTCTSGSLVGTVPSCVGGCTATAPTNGLVDGAPTVSVTDTNTVTYSCNSGYILTSGATLTCTSGSLVGTVPTCVVGCTATAPTNGLVDGAPTVSVTDTNTVTYSCNSGYILTSGATLTCTSGSLVGTVPSCVGGCTATAPANGLVDGAPTVSVTDTNTVTYSCNSGYILTSGATLTCTSGSLVGTVPSCVVGCTATAPANGLVDGAPTVSVTDTNTVTYSCNSGYILTSGATLTCTSGSLVGTVPSCVVGCTATAPANGLVDGEPTVSVTDTNTVTYSCNSGYILTSGATLTCTSGSLVGTVPSCVVGCTATAPANGLVDGAPTVSVTDTNTVRYSCNSGYILTSGATLTCTSGSLVGTVPSCVVGCTATAPANGLVDGAPTVSVTDTNTVTYSCNSGYILTSGATLTCTSGSLVGTVPSCVVGCTATAPANGLVDGEPTVSVTDTNTVTYSCNSGYILTSGATLTCTSGSLVGTVPSCVVGCTATAPANGLVDGAPTVSVTDTNTVTYSCNSGYILTSGSTLTCTSGSLVGTVPSCVGGCTATAPTNGLVDGAPTVSVTDTNTVTYSCNSGYILTSGATLTCTSGSLVGTVPTCVVGCTATAPANGLVDGAPTVSVTDTNTVTYSCNSGYILTSGATLTCTSGSLVGTVPSCVVGCTATAPANGLVDGEPTVSVTDTNTVTYSCNSGYILTSGATLTCTSGSLVGTVPSCVVGCTATAPANGLVDGAPTVSVTDTNTVTYSCNSGYILTSGSTLTCTSGSLVGTVPSCVGGCTAIAPTNGLVDGAPTVSVTDTNTVTYSCNSGYILTSGATLTCTSGSLVGTVPTCVVGCTATAPANGLVDGAPTVSVTDTNTVTYSCNSGYILTSGATLTCTSGSLVGTVPSCVGGCTATAPANGLVDSLATSSVTNTNTVTYSCNSGYILSSAATLTCTSGSLVGTVPTCDQGCTATAPANGLVDNLATSSVTNTNTVTYSCNSGYILSSAATLTCTSGSLVGSVPTCDQGCTATAPANGLVDNLATSSVTNTNTVTYSCNSGYILSSAATLTCTSGSLVGTVPTCDQGCTATAPANGLVDSLATSSVTITNTVTYSCNSGYILSSAATLTCTSGSLVGTVPTCDQGCTATAPANGLVDNLATSSVTNTNTVTYSCNSGYILSSAATLTCTSGSLVGSVPTCNGDCTPTAPANGAVEPITVVHGAMVTFSCETGYIVQGTATATCNDGAVTAATCAQDCTTAAPANGAVTATTAIHDTSVTYSCDSGYAVIGTATPTCDDGTFTSTPATCSSVPVFAANSPTTASLEENTVVGTTVTNVITAAGDADLTYALTSQTPDSTPKIFAVASASGLLTIATSPDYETATSYDLVITVTSSKGTANDAADDTSAQHTITVSITDVDDSAVMEKASILMIFLLLVAKYL